MSFFQFRVYNFFIVFGVLSSHQLPRRRKTTLKYIVHTEIDPETGAEMEAQPEKIQEWMSIWQSLRPIGMYFGLTRRAVTVIVTTLLTEHSPFPRHSYTYNGTVIPMFVQC
jgi:hypothetical protein